MTEFIKDIIYNILDTIDANYCIKCKERSKCYGYDKAEYCWFCKNNDMKNKIVKVDNETSTNFVIGEFVKVHSKRYNYDKSNYKNNITEIIIICNIHGEFLQTPKNHKKCQGCPECGKKTKNIKNLLIEAKCNSIDEIITNRIEKAKINNQNKYIYKFVKFVYGIWPIVTIICPIHGIFTANFNRHSNGRSGCQKCAITKITKNLVIKKLTKEEIITRCSKIFSNYYSYELMIVPKNVNFKISIICPNHGVFEQKLDSHLKGYGCFRCSNSYVMTQEEFKYRIEKIHNNTIDLSMTLYENKMKKIYVRCLLHNKVFNIRPFTLLNGATNCPSCKIKSASKIANNCIHFLMKYYNIYIQYYDNDGEYKIPNTNYYVDGYIRESNIIIQFHGSYYHGEPRVYPATYLNKKVNKTMGELFENTRKISNMIRKKGYKLIEIWEYDWTKFVKSIKIIQRKWRKYKNIECYVCKECNNTYPNIIELRDHINKEHTEIQVIRSKNNYEVENLIEKPSVNIQLPKKYKKKNKEDLNVAKTNSNTPPQIQEKTIYECKTCNYKSEAKNNFERHMKSKRHIEKEKNKDIEYQYTCENCGYKSNSRKRYLEHCKTKTHLKKIQ